MRKEPIVSINSPDEERPADPDKDPQAVEERDAFVDDERRDGYPDQDPAEVPPLEEPEGPPTPDDV